MSLVDFDVSTMFDFDESKLSDDYTKLTKEELLTEAKTIALWIDLTSKNIQRYNAMLREEGNPYIGIGQCESAIRKYRERLEVLEGYKERVKAEWYGRKGGK